AVELHGEVIIHVHIAREARGGAAGQTHFQQAGGGQSERAAAEDVILLHNDGQRRIAVADDGSTGVGVYDIDLKRTGGAAVEDQLAGSGKTAGTADDVRRRARERPRGSAQERTVQGDKRAAGAGV